MRDRCAGLAWVLIASFLVTVPQSLPAHAGMIDTASIVQDLEAERDRVRLEAFLSRQDVADRLAAMGVDPLDISQRVQALTDQEIVSIAAHLDQAPAGQNAVVAFVGAGVTVVLILIVTDLLGLTDVFTFVDPAG